MPAPNAATTRSPTEEIARLRLERDLFQRLLELGSRDDMRPFLEDALALIAEVTGARKGYIEIDRPGRANAGGGEESNEPRLWIARGLSEDELAQARRALAEICAVLLAIAVAFGRIEAREAVLWNEQPTRADRALEILAAAAERTASSVIAAACLALILLLRALDLARARSPSLRPPLRAAAPLIAAILLAIAADIALHVRFLRTRDDLREALAPQFSLFARLDPPVAGDPALTPPHAAPAAQLTRDIVAINGVGVARLGALRSPEGALNIGRDLNHALASSLKSAPPGAPDLSIAVDREVDYGSLLLFLRIARSAGVKRGEILLTRGRAPALPASAPPEASYVLASDFAAVPIELSDEGFEARDGDSFDQVAPALVLEAARLRGSASPVRVAVRSP